MGSKELKILESKLEKFYANRLPDFYERLSQQKTSLNPCFNCLKETEETVKSKKWKKFPKPIKFWYEMCDAESREIRKFLKKKKPKRILEVGFGAGRVINAILSVKYPKEITAIDSNKSIFKITKPFFKKYKNVKLICGDLKQFLKKKGNFDLAVCVMNTFGNIDEEETLKLLANKSKNVIFSVYDKSASNLRAEIYKLRGHSNFATKNGTYYFKDFWVKGLKSKSYSKKELVRLCSKTGKNFKIKKISTLLFMVHLY